MCHVTVIGAGLAGCEAAYQASKFMDVTLVDCKPHKFSAAHSMTEFAELVCSNSLKSNGTASAGGLIKEELRHLDSLLIRVADAVCVPAGGALAVDRRLFSEGVTKIIAENKRIKIVSELRDDFDENAYTIIATGPLTMGSLCENIERKLGNGKTLHFYDAAAPIISADSIDFSRAFMADRYARGDSDYINCPMTREEYEVFWAALVAAERALTRDFEKREIFEGCMPIEIMAERGADTLRFGPLKPVGFIDPKTDKRPYAVVQLRAENAGKTMYNMVGFQTNLKFGEQKRVFGLIPALKNAEFLRYGVMHRNSYIDAPHTINEFFESKKCPKVFIAGQLSGVEGYVESMASGLMCGLNVARYASGKNMLCLPSDTIIGALAKYLTVERENFQPMNANFGILDAYPTIKNKDERKIAFGVRALASLENFKKQNNLDVIY